MGNTSYANGMHIAHAELRVDMARLVAEKTDPEWMWQVLVPFIQRVNDPMKFGEQVAMALDASKNPNGKPTGVE